MSPYECHLCPQSIQGGPEAGATHGLKKGRRSDPENQLRSAATKPHKGTTPSHANAQVPLSRGTDEERSEESGGWGRHPDHAFTHPGRRRKPPHPHWRANSSGDPPNAHNRISQISLPGPPFSLDP